MSCAKDPLDPAYPWFPSAPMAPEGPAASTGGRRSLDACDCDLPAKEKNGSSPAPNPLADPQFAGLSLDEKRELLRRLIETKAAAASRPQEASAALNGESSIPASRGQKALWFLHQAAPLSPAYNFLYVAKLAQVVDSAALRRSMARLSERHASLRTTFHYQDGALRQKIGDKPNFEYRIQTEARIDDERLLQIARMEADRPFNLENGPLFRAILIERGARDYVLFFVFHHIIADLWSMDAMLEELATIYAAEQAGGRADLPPLQASYVDFTKQQDAVVASARGRELWRQWKSRLEGANASLELPTTRPRPAVPTQRGDTLSWFLDDELTTSLRRLAVAESTTLFVTLLAAFQTLLARYSGQREFLVGTASLGRHREQYENVVGYFLNQLPLRAKLDEETTFRDLLCRVRDEVLGALDLEEYPFVELVERLRPKRVDNRHPLFQVMFVWNNPREAASTSRADGSAAFRDRTAKDSLSELNLQRILMEQRGAPFELTLIVMELGGRLRLSLTYDAELFDGGFIARMSGHLQTLLRAAVQNPAAPALSLPLLDETERLEVLTMSRGPERAYADSLNIHQWIEQQVRRAPDATAVEASTTRRTYDQLNRRANQWARRLIQAGVRRGDRVGLMMERNADALTAILAIWKAGAAYVPIDPTLPVGRISFLIDDADVRFIVSSMSVGDRAPTSAATTLWVGDSFGANESDADLSPIAGPDDAAYVIYTSGSTGVPKGVTAHHRGLCHYVEICRHRCAISPQDRILLFSSFSFDASVHEIMMAFGAGATLVIGDDQELLVGDCLARTLADRRITMATAPPSVLATIPAEYAERLKDLRMLMSAGEPCPAELPRLWAPGRVFYNAYGPTEATIWSTAALCEGNGQTPTIGRPNINTRVYILNDELQLAPIGVPGELCIAGPGVTRGYLNRPNETAERFIPDPFAPPQCGPDARMLYRTGDLARYRSDGQIEYLGRRDRQLKIRGFRVESGEIEAALLGVEGVDQAAAAGWRDPKGRQQLAAYVVAKNGVDLTVADLRAGLAPRLPAYLIPSRFVVLQAMPRLISGKIDYAALPAPEALRPELDVEYAPPETPVQKALATIWSELLQTDRIGIHDNFFELGGTSLDLVQARHRAREYGIELSIDAMLARQTIAELSAFCATASVKEPADATPAVVSAAAPKSRRPPKTSLGQMVFESIGVYFPPRSVTTDEIVAGCAAPLEFPLSQMTGILRRPAADGEYSIDLARRAIADCLARSRFSPADVDVLICCNISRYDGPNHRFSFEPSTAARLQGEFGFVHAVSFDVSNACAGFFTALSFCESLMRTGAARRCLVVSGEYITHLARTAQQEITSFLDPRVACLTLGDSGLAAMVEISDRTDEGFQALDLMTIGKYADLCVAKATSGVGLGAIMLTDAIQSTEVTLRQAVRHAMSTLKTMQWRADDVDYVVVHQTSSTTIKGVVRELNRAFARTICTDSNTIDNLAERGNMGPNSILVAMVDAVRRGVIQSGSNVVFGVSGSGQVIGTALYRMGDLPDRLLAPAGPPLQHPLHGGKAATTVIRPASRLRIAAAAAGPADAGSSSDALQLAANAAKACIARSARDPGDVGLLLHVGIYRNEFLAEPALASMIARDAGFNPAASVDDERQTLACDLMNGGAGFLNACFVAGQTIMDKGLKAAIITASEIENNRQVRDDHLVGLFETGSAVLLEPSSENGEGFIAFGFKNIADHVDGRTAYTQEYRKRMTLRIDQDRNWIESCIDGAARTAAEFLATLDVAPNRLTAVLTSQPSPDFGLRLGSRLSLPSDKVVALELQGKDPFTSAVPLAFAKVRSEGRAPTGSLALLLEVGAGMQIACALYQF